MLPNILVPASEQSNGAKRPSVILGPSSVAMRQDVFDEALLDKALAGHGRKPVDWVISAALHVAVVAAVVLVPLFFTQALDMSRLETTFLVAPPTPYAPPPPPAAASATPQALRKPVLRLATLTMPVAIPKTVQMLHDASDYSAESFADVSAGVPGGVAGGVPGGVLGGILGGSGLSAPPPPPAVVAVVSNKPLHIGGEVKAPRAISTPQPSYPLLALQARIEGDVQIDAVIDQHGNVVQMRAISGPPLLINAALKAVSNWKYQPTVLNGQPYPVELTVDVTFQLS